MEIFFTTLFFTSSWPLVHLLLVPVDPCVLDLSVTCSPPLQSVPLMSRGRNVSVRLALLPRFVPRLHLLGRWGRFCTAETVTIRVKVTIVIHAIAILIHVSATRWNFASSFPCNDNTCGLGVISILLSRRGAIVPVQLLPTYVPLMALGVQCTWNHLEHDGGGHGDDKHLWIVFLFISRTKFPWSRPRARLGQHKEGRVGLLDLRQQSCWVWLSGEIIFIFFIFLENTWMQPGIFSSSSSSSLSSSMSRCKSVSLFNSSSVLVATKGWSFHRRCSGEQLRIVAFFHYYCLLQITN